MLVILKGLLFYYGECSSLGDNVFKISDSKLKELAKLEEDYDISAGPELMMLGSLNILVKEDKNKLLNQDDLLSALEVKKLLKLPCKKINISCRVSTYNAQIFDYQDQQIILVSDGSTKENKSHKSLTNCFEEIATEIDRFIPKSSKRIWVQEEKGVLYQVTLKCDKKHNGFYNPKWIPLNKTNKS